MKKLKYITPILTILKNTINWFEALKLYFLPREMILKLKNGVVLKINSFHNLISIKEVFIDKEYSFNKINPKIIIDIGANLGDSTVFFAKTYPKAKILALEPSVSTFKILKENIRLNKIKNCNLFKLGIGSKKGEFSFFESKKSGLSSLYKHDSSINEQKIKLITLKSLFGSNRIKMCDLLKIDCEGAEFDIILNSPSTTFKKIKRMIIEYHNELTPHKHGELIKYLKVLKFNVRVKKHSIEKNIGIIYATK